MPDSLTSPSQIGPQKIDVTISSGMSMDKHVTNVCKSAYLKLHRIGSIRHLLTLLTVDTAKILVLAFLLSKLDYCSSLFSVPLSTFSTNLD